MNFIKSLFGVKESCVFSRRISGKSIVALPTDEHAKNSQEFRVARLAIVVGILVTALCSSASLRADAVSDWNKIMVSIVRTAPNPFFQGRYAAITEVAVFEAVNACIRQYQPYIGTITGDSGCSPEAAAVAAAHDVLVNYFPAAAATLDVDQANSLALLPDGTPKTSGISVGQAAAAAMIALRANDGSTPIQTFLPTSSVLGVWQPTPPAFSPGILLNWRNVTPFAVRTSDQFRVNAPPDLTSRKYTTSYNEVLEVGDVNSASRPQDRTDVAHFYALVNAPEVWNNVAQQITQARGTPLADKARAFALINMAISDGLVTVMESKYFYVRWRPVTAIRAGDTDGNPATEPNPSFTPLITTPPFPGYPSAHASASYGAREILERLFGCGPYTITLLSPRIPTIVLHYSSLAGITEDIDDARVFGGIHFRYDQEAGGRQGQRIGSFVFSHKLRPLTDSGSSEEDGGPVCAD